MKNRFYTGLILGALLLAVAPPALRAQSYSVPWFVAASGGGTTKAGLYCLSGTFAQWDASEQPLTNGLYSLTGGFWSFLATDQTALFSDIFNGNSVDPTKWMASGNTVIESNGVMEVLNTVTNAGGVLTSVPIVVNGTGLIIITRRVFLHAQPSSSPDYPGTYFMGQFGIAIGALAPFSVNYASMDYADSVTYMARNGFFLARDGQSPLYIASQASVSPAINPVWDTWFNEEVTYDPITGVVQYFINDALQMTFNAGVLPPTNSTTLTLSFNAWGWGTGNEQLFEDLLVTQAPGVSNSAPAISLSGNLAFGGVAVNTTSNLTLTISNAGATMLTVSNITYPVGFAGQFSGVIAPGASTNVTVAFSPTAATNYSGSLTIHTDETNGPATMPISGFGANGTLTLIIDINGNGSVSPNLNGKSLAAGTRHTVRAIAGPGQVFSNWSGSIMSSKNPLTFTMKQSTVLQANFIPSPFASVKGTYNGLFATTNGVTEETAGMLKELTVGEKGTYSGALLINGASHPISGNFGLSGQASNSIPRPARQGGALLAKMTLDWNTSPPQITGTVSGTTNEISWVANLIANRSTNRGTAKYTMLLAPTEFGQADLPSGYGYLLTAKHNGVLALSGALADGTSVSQTVPVSETGDVPVYASLYGHTGLLTGWVNMAEGGLAGSLHWIKKPAPRSVLYPNGFTNLVLAQGASWTNLSPAAIIDLSAGKLNIFGGTLPSPLSFDVVPSDKNDLTKSSNYPTNSLAVSINPKTGLLMVTFGNGDGNATTTGRGAVLQNRTNAAGFFLGKTNTGSIILEP